MHTNGFEQIVESIELDRLSEELETRMCKLKDERNLEVVTLGEQAVRSGLIRHGTIHTTTWDTVRRQRAMMQRIGYAPLRPHERSFEGDSMRVDSKRVHIARDISVALRQRTVSLPSGRGFWKTVFDEGVDYAIDQYMSPGTTVIVAFRDESGDVAMSQCLAPSGYSSPDERFRGEWGRDMSPFFETELYKSAREIEYEHSIAPTSVHMSEKGLIVAAGYNVVFNGLLDEVESHL